MREFGHLAALAGRGRIVLAIRVRGTLRESEPAENPAHPEQRSIAAAPYSKLTRSRAEPVLKSKQDRYGKRHHRAVARHGQDRRQAQAVLKTLAGAATQRSLCGAGQAGGIALARGLQIDRDR